MEGRSVHIDATSEAYPLFLTDNLMVLGNYYFNLYLVRGEQSTALVEAGVSAVADRVIGQLSALGVAPDYLVVTHPHTDHISGLAALVERFPRAIVIAGDGTREFVEHPKAAGMMTAEDRFISDQLARRGIVPGRPPGERIVLPRDHVAVARNTVLDLGGISLHCLPVKGHSPGSIAVHVPQIKALLVSDALGYHLPGRGFCPLFFAGLADYLATLDELAVLAPAFVGPGHQGPFTGATAVNAIADARNAALEIYARIKTDARPDDRVAQELFDEFYRDEFTLYSEDNIRNCMRLLVRRVREAEL